MKVFLSLMVCVFVLLSSADRGLAVDYWNEESSEQRELRMEWWRKSRFGMFIHWGLYAIPAGEWEGKTRYAEWIRHRAQIPIETYDQFVRQFNPVRFDAEQWVLAAKRAGMKYMVITSKHHDGFCLWPSELTDYDIESTPFKRDILGELTQACRTHDLRMCFYHSIMDWHHPNYPPRAWEKERPDDQVDIEKYTAYMKGQLKELIERYEPAVLWFDGEWEKCWTHERGSDLYQYVRSLKPDIIINNRVDKGRRGMQGMTRKGEFRGDFGTPEQEIPHTGIPGVDWESCMTMNRHWGWNRNDKAWKNTPDLIRKIVDITSKGGNYLLNVGPKADGTFPEEALERLEGIGKWMQHNGESIYGTAASPTDHTPWGRVTVGTGDRSGTLYLHVFEWPEKGELELRLGNRVTGAEFLASGERLEVTSSPDGKKVIIHLPGEPSDPVDTVVAVRIEGQPDFTEFRISQRQDGSFLLDAGLAELRGDTIRLEHKAESGNIGYWLDPEDFAVWRIEIADPGTFEAVLVYAAVDEAGCRLSLDGQEITGKCESTGSWEDFRDLSVGTLAIQEAGDYVLAIKRSADLNPVNVSRIILRKLRDHGN